MLDEIFGRQNYLTSFYIQVRYPEKTLKQDMAFHKEIEQVHIYRKEYDAKPNQNIKSTSFDKFKYHIEEIKNGKEILLGGKKTIIFNSDEYRIVEGKGSEDGLKEIWATGTILDGNSSGRFFRDYLAGRFGQDGFGVLYKVFGIGDDKFDYRYFTGPKRMGATKGKYYQGVPVTQLESPGQEVFSPIENFYDMAGSFGNCRLEGSADFRSGKKPEVLLKIIFQHFSKYGDLVLDSFAGSGTSGAVAHKMGRKWIMVELGEHCRTHIVPRMKQVIGANDSGGITNEANWLGGGGFRFYQLGVPIFTPDGRINEKVRFASLAAHVWFCETKIAYRKPKRNSPFLGIHNGTAIALLYNGILGDRSVGGGNVLTSKTLQAITDAIGNREYDRMIVYGEWSRIGTAKLKRLKILFKQIPYEVR
jgi:adenine-specific DNA-methyltransferase